MQISMLQKIYFNCNNQGSENGGNGHPQGLLQTCQMDQGYSWDVWSNQGEMNQYRQKSIQFAVMNFILSYELITHQLYELKQIPYSLCTCLLIYKMGAGWLTNKYLPDTVVIILNETVSRNIFQTKIRFPCILCLNHLHFFSKNFILSGFALFYKHFKFFLYAVFDCFNAKQ